MSPDGSCRAFDAESEGDEPGERLRDSSVKEAGRMQ